MICHVVLILMMSILVFYGGKFLGSVTLHDRTKAVSSIPSSKERGKLISAHISARELYDVYQQLRDDYNTKAFHKSNAARWKTIRKSTDGIHISLLQHPEDPSCPYVRMDADLIGDIEDVWDFLSLENWPKYMPKMDPFYEGVTIEGTYQHRGVEMVLARKRTVPLISGVYGKRDFTFISVSDVPRSDGVRASGTVSVRTDKLPRQKGYTRAYQDSVAFYKQIGDDKETGYPRTLLTIVCRIDLNDSGDDGEGGGIPMWLYVKTIGTTGVLSLRNMRHEIRGILDARLMEEARTREADNRGRTKSINRRFKIPI